MIYFILYCYITKKTKSIYKFIITFAGFNIYTFIFIRILLKILYKALLIYSINILKRFITIYIEVLVGSYTPTARARFLGQVHHQT